MSRVRPEPPGIRWREFRRLPLVARTNGLFFLRAVVVFSIGGVRTGIKYSPCKLHNSFAACTRTADIFGIVLTAVPGICPYALAECREDWKGHWGENKKALLERLSPGPVRNTAEGLFFRCPGHTHRLEDQHRTVGLPFFVHTLNDHPVYQLCQPHP
jgi:hypothetical protein